MRQQKNTDLPEVNEPITITSGAFASFNGHVKSVDAVRQKVDVEVVVFGRPTRVTVSRDAIQRSAPLDPALLSEPLARLEDAAPEVRIAAATALGDLGSRATSTLPALIDTYHQEKQAAARTAVVEAMGKIDAAGAETVLVQALSDRSRRVIAAALGALRRRGQDADETLRAAAARHLTHRHPEVQEAAVRAVWSFAHPDDLPALVQVIDEGASQQVRITAALAVARQEPADPAPIIAAVARLAEDLRADPRCRDVAHYILGRLKAADTLRPMLADPDPVFRSQAATALCSCAEEGDVADIVAVLQGLSATWQRKALVKGMGSLGVLLDAAAPALHALASEPELTDAVIDAFQESRCQVALLSLADHPNEPVQSTAVHTLARAYALDEAEQVPLLVRKLRSDSARIRRSAARGLKRHREVAGVLDALRAAQRIETDPYTKPVLDELVE